MSELEKATAELKAAVLEYREATAALNMWTIVTDEGGPIGHEARMAYNRVVDAKIRQVNRHNAAESRLLNAALNLAEVL